MRTTITILSALAVSASISFAQDTPAALPPVHRGNRPSLEERFKKLDANSDGFLTLDEFKAGPMAQWDPAKAEEIYKKMDANSDGKLTLEEFKAFHPDRGRHGHHGFHGDHGVTHTAPAASPEPAK